jgi:hypothetical protein
MFRKGQKYYSDCINLAGRRCRKAFDSEHEALAHEHLQSAIKLAHKLGKHQRAFELWEHFELIEQPLRALTDAAGWSPFTTEEIEACISDLTLVAVPKGVPRLAGVGRRVRRRTLLSVLLGSFFEGGPQSVPDVATEATRKDKFTPTAEQI